MDEVISKTKKHKRKHKYDIEKEEKAELGRTEAVTVGSNDFMSQINEKKDKKKKKKKSKHGKSEQDMVSEGKIETETDIVETVSNKRKVSEIENELDEVKSEKKRKRKDRKREGENQNDVGEVLSTEDAAATDTSHQKKKKKSKKKKSESDTDIGLEGPVENAEDVKPHEENNKNVREITDGKEKKKHKKKKKHSCGSEELEEMVETKGQKEESLCPDTKKKKKNDRKYRKKNKETDEECDDTNSTNKNEKSSFKEGVKDVNKLDTQTNEIPYKEKKSQEINGCAEAADGENVKSGQWSSVELGDSDRQNKFFRLLGGFKKGSDTSQIQNKFSLGKKPVFGTSNNSPKRTGGNFAMNKKQENIYTKALEGEYERAMTMNLNRGIGLGFEKPPEEGKKFYIDTKSSKSVKFDD